MLVQFPLTPCLSPFGKACKIKNGRRWPPHPQGLMMVVRSHPPSLDSDCKFPTPPMGMQDIARLCKQATVFEKMRTWGAGHLRACKNNSSRVVGQLWSMSDLYSRRWPRYLSVACGKRPQRIRLLRTLPNMDRPECCDGEKRMELYPTTTSLGMAILKWVAIQYLSVKRMRY